MSDSPQLSVAVMPGSPGTSDRQVTVTSAGVALRTGAMLSAMVTVCVCVVTLPAQSVVVHVFVTVPLPTHVGAALWV